MPLAPHPATRVEVLHGCAIEELDLEPDGSVQMCVTSPPYFGLRSYLPEGHPMKRYEIGTEKTPQEYVAKLVQVFRAVRRVRADDGTLWLNLGDTYAQHKGGTAPPAQTVAGGVGGHGGQKEHRGQKAGYNPSRDPFAHGMKHKDLMGIPWRVAFALQDDGWYLRQDIIWHKPNPMPESVRDRCTKAHEYIFMLSKKPKYYYDHEAVKEPSAWGRENNPEWQHARAATNANKHPSNRNGKSAGFANWSPEQGRNKRSVWTVNTKPYKGAHFATFPPELIRPCILAGSRPGDTVLDPFGGSGTTGMVARQEGRNALLCELNADYLPLIQQRTA